MNMDTNRSPINSDICRSTPDGNDFAYARVDYDAEKRAGQTTLDYWQWVDAMHAQETTRREMVLRIGGTETWVFCSAHK